VSLCDNTSAESGIEIFLDSLETGKKKDQKISVPLNFVSFVIFVVKKFVGFRFALSCLWIFWRLKCLSLKRKT